MFYENYAREGFPDGNGSEEIRLKDLNFAVNQDLMFKLLAQPISSIMSSAQISDDVDDGVIMPEECPTVTLMERSTQIAAVAAG